VPMTDAQELATACGPGVAVVGFSGPESDVLSRFVGVLRDRPHYDIVMRITGDCPRLDPEIAQQVVDLHVSTPQTAYTWNVSPGYVDGEDVEVMDRQAIFWAHKRAHEAEDREHVTPIIRRHLPITTLPARDDRGWMMKTSVDTPADFVRLQRG